MIRITTFSGRRVAVFGLGGSGLAAARALRDGHATVVCWDDGGAQREAAQADGFTVEDLADADWSGIAAVVLAPGVPLTHPEPHWVVQKARAAGAEIIGDIELFFRQRAADCPEAPVVCITGTNGKSTTTALVSHILRTAGRNVQMGGNIGKAILTLEPPSMDRIHVIEISSFQIDLTPSLAPSIGVLMNLTPDHLDRHGPADDLDLAMRNYAGIKERVIARAGHAVVSLDDIWSSMIAKRQTRPVVTISARAGVAADITVVGDQVRVGESALAGLSGLGPFSLAGINTLRGSHNAQNACAAIAVAGLLKLTTETTQRGLQTYPGLPHRLEDVGRAGRVLFINDSKATNADSTEKALSAFPSDIYWILGGKPKEGGITTLEPLFSRVAKAYLIGAASDQFAETLEGKVVYERCGTLVAAVAAAARDAQADAADAPVVLLSPACASYDQFKNFEVRGDAFRALVAALPGVHGRERTA